MAKATRSTMETWIVSLQEAIDAKEKAEQNATSEEVKARLNEEGSVLIDIIDAIQNYFDL